MNVRRLVQCYRCRRLFVPRGRGVERFCPDCAAEMRQRLTFGLGENWRALLVVVGGIALLMLLSGRRLVPTLLASAIIIAWYIYLERRGPRF